MLIGVDHGNKQIKTVHCVPFVSGLQQSMTRPFGPSLQYGGNYYTLSNERIPYRKDKTGDDRFFILTLIAIAEELTARGVDEKELYHIQLPVGLPPAHFGAQAEKFTAYFQKKGIVEFQYRDKHYAISIDDVACYPQAYAAAATMLHTLMNEAKAVVVDIGGFTADYPDSKACSITALLRSPAAVWYTSKAARAAGVLEISPRRAVSAADTVWLSTCCFLSCSLKTLGSYSP